MIQSTAEWCIANTKVKQRASACLLEQSLLSIEKRPNGKESVMKTLSQGVEIQGLSVSNRATVGATAIKRIKR